MHQFPNLNLKGRKEGRKEMFCLMTHSTHLFMVIWCGHEVDRLLFIVLCGMMHIKEPLLLIRKVACGGSGFPLSLSEW